MKTRAWVLAGLAVVLMGAEKPTEGPRMTLKLRGLPGCGIRVTVQNPGNADRELIVKTTPDGDIVVESGDVKVTGGELILIWSSGGGND
jgi:hypothetical protein